MGIKVTGKGLSVDLRYAREEHRDLPHFVNMSGGRSSAAMALMLAEQGGLDPDRGDAVVFLNTSAEHPDTYRFAARVSEEVEGYGIPVFWLEFCTVEVIKGKRPKPHRVRWWRLVNREPYDSQGNRWGYRSDGSVFEEVISFGGMIPTLYNRICTEQMKVGTAVRFRQEWLSGSVSTCGGGHTGARHLSAKDRAEVYRGSKLTRDEAVAYFSKSFDDSLVRVPPQRWDAYTGVGLNRTGAPTVLGVKELQYCLLMGLRADEPKRVERVIDRMLFSQGCGSSRYPPGEQLMVPLYDSGISKRDIVGWWGDRGYDLDIPSWAGNCTFCFMKTPKVVGVGQASERLSKTIPEQNTPLSWWVEMEEKYAHEGYKGLFGFFGQGKPSFRELMEVGATGQFDFGEPEGLPCDCTD